MINGQATELDFVLESLSEEVLMPGPSTTPAVAYQLTEQVINKQASTPEPPVQRPHFSHHSYLDLEVYLQQISSVYSAFAQLYSIGQSVLGRELYVMKISSNLGIDEPGRPLDKICGFTLNYFTATLE